MFGQTFISLTHKKTYKDVNKNEESSTSHVCVRRHVQININAYHVECVFFDVWIQKHGLWYVLTL